MVFGFTWHIFGLPDDDPRRTYVEFTLEPAGDGTRLTVVESGFAQLPTTHSARRSTATRTAGSRNWASWPTTSMPPDIEAIAEQVFIALADPTRRAILADAGGRRPGHGDGPGHQAADHAAGDRQAPGAAVRGRPGDGRARRAAAGAVPAPVGPDAGGAAVPGRAGSRLGQPARRAEETTSTKLGLKQHQNGGSAMKTPQIVTPQEWEAAPPAAAGEGEGGDPGQGRARGRAPPDAVGRGREGRTRSTGRTAGSSLLDLFEGRRQLIVYRAFFEPGVYGWPGPRVPGLFAGGRSGRPPRSPERPRHHARVRLARRRSRTSSA